MPWDRGRSQRDALLEMLFGHRCLILIIYIFADQKLVGLQQRRRNRLMFPSLWIPFHGRVSSLLESPVCLLHLPNLRVNQSAGITLSLLPLQRLLFPLR